MISIVFAIFKSSVRIIDNMKRATLSRLLLESVISTTPGEKLDEKLASWPLPSDFADRKSNGTHSLTN
jgi:synaptojanin